MDKRYLIFISSTYEDLKVEREKVTRAILDLNNIPARMENFPAAGVRPKDLIERVIKECDYFVLIIGSRYGSISDSGKSFTEEEYNYAVNEGIPVIAFIQDGIKERHDDDYKKLLAFKELVKHGTHSIRTLTSPDELMAIVATSLHNAININPRPGWVRAAAVDSTNTVVNNQIKESQSRNALPDVLDAADGDTAKSHDIREENSDFWDKELIARTNIGFDYWDKHNEIPYSIKRTLKEWFIPIAQSIYDSVSDVTLYGIVHDLQDYLMNDTKLLEDIKNSAVDYIARLRIPRKFSLNQSSKNKATTLFLKGLLLYNDDIETILNELQKAGLIVKDRSSILYLSERGVEYLEKFVYQEY